MNDEYREIIAVTVKEFIEKMGFSATVEVSLTETPVPVFFCSAQVSDGQNFLIGQYGMNLAALQHLVRILIRRKLGEKLDIIVDINDYFLEKRKLLEQEAAEAMEEALQRNAPVVLRPMLPYERKIVHAFLSTQESVLTESAGVGEGRRVTVLPKTLAGE